jgi:acyl carrier protein
MMDPIKEQIKKVMSAVFEVPVEKITEDSSPDNIESWDSLKHLNLILALEEEFDIIIPDEEVGNILNFKLIELIINECKK